MPLYLRGYLTGRIDEIQEKTGKLSAVAEAKYGDYFRNTRITYAIKIEDLVVFEKHRLKG
jgi:hypothetical protein